MFDQQLDLTPAHQHNRRRWDEIARQQQRFGQPILAKDFDESLQALQGDPWFEGRLPSARLLCLGSGGGRQSVLYAAAGAQVTVVDISNEMLALDRQLAQQRRLDVRIVQCSMESMPALNDASFDFVVQPVSTCYVPDLAPVYAEVARILVPGGLYISQHKQPASLQCASEPSGDGYLLNEPYFRQGPLPAVTGSQHREEGTFEFLHRWESLIGGMCRAGFVVEDLSEPPHGKPDAARGSFAHRSHILPPYVRIKARRR